MADYITLLGAEQVQNAAGTMREAAQRMNSAASNMQYAFDQHQRFLEQWLADFKDAIEQQRQNNDNLL